MQKRINRFFQSIAISNLTAVLLFTTALVSGFGLSFHSDIGVLAADDIAAGHYSQLLLMPFRIEGSWLSLVFQLYFVWIFGTSLEAAMGHLKYNAYIITGLGFTWLGGFLFPGVMSSIYLHLSIFLAVTYFTPNMEILLFFILPIKLKYLAMVTAVFIYLLPIIDAIQTLSFYPLTGPIMGTANYLLYIGLDAYRTRRGVRRSKHRMEKFKVVTRTSFHRCTACNRSELDDAHLEFRYCVRCDREYCMDHLADHTCETPGKP